MPLYNYGLLDINNADGHMSMKKGLWKLQIAFREREYLVTPYI